MGRAAIANPTPQTHLKAWDEYWKTLRAELDLAIAEGRIIIPSCLESMQGAKPEPESETLRTLERLDKNRRKSHAGAQQ